MENVLKLLAKSVLMSLRLTEMVSATDAAIQQEHFQIRFDYTDNIIWRTERYHENS